MNSQCTKCGSRMKIYRLFYNSALNGQFETFFTLLKEPWRYFTTGFRPKKKTLNVYLCNSNYVKWILNTPNVAVRWEFANSSTILHPVDSLELFFTLLKEPWSYFKTGFRPKKKTLNVYLCKFNTMSTYITSQ